MAEGLLVFLDIAAASDSWAAVTPPPFRRADEYCAIRRSIPGGVIEQWDENGGTRCCADFTTIQSGFANRALPLKSRKGFGRSDFRVYRGLGCAKYWIGWRMGRFGTTSSASSADGEIPQNASASFGFTSSR